MTQSGPFTIAPLWRRLAAMMYDSFLVIAIWIIVGFLVMSAFGIDQARTENGVLRELSALHQNTLFAAMIVSAFLFFGWFWTNSGQTLGMQAWRIKVQNADGSAIGWEQVALRFVTAPFSLALCGLGYLLMLIDAEKRTVPDIVSKSQVVRVQL